MLTAPFDTIRADCLLAWAEQAALRSSLGRRHIAVTGGTGFLGTWIAESIAALNDEYRLGIRLDLYARDLGDWRRRYPHLAARSDITLVSQDVRSPFEYARTTSLVVHAAGIPNNRVHASDPLRVHQTTLQGLNNALAAAAQLDNLSRFLNVSSCLVSGAPEHGGALAETDVHAVPVGQPHRVYADAKRAAESLAAIYRSQLRLPVSTIRPFTFAGAYQALDRPWAINNFLRDVLSGGDIRIHGDGSARRSYLYGSDAACWTLAALVNGADGQVYNVGSAQPVSHLELARLIVARVAPRAQVVLNTAPGKASRVDDLFPDCSVTTRSLGVAQTCSLEQTIEKTWRWYAAMQG